MPSVLGRIWTQPIADLSEPELWELYEKCLKGHDWYYNYSDDHSVWRNGCTQSDRLTTLRGQLSDIDEARSNRMYWLACPWLEMDGSRKEGS